MCWGFLTCGPLCSSLSSAREAGKQRRDSWLHEHSSLSWSDKGVWRENEKKMVRPFGLYGRKSRFSKKVLSATDVLTLKQKCLNVLLFQHTEVRQKVENLCYVQL